MAAQAAHLVDRILPAVPIRQFVLSFPFEKSLLAATKPEVLRALARIHAEELARHYKQAAKKSGEGGKLHAGAVTFVQRFGSSLNLHVHLHTCALDGVYVEGDDGEAPRFVPASAPSRAELYVLTERVALRVMTWLRKHSCSGWPISTHSRFWFPSGLEAAALKNRFGSDRDTQEKHCAQRANPAGITKNQTPRELFNGTAV